MIRPTAWIAWSSGKDAAWALYVARQANDLDIVTMLTTITASYDRVSMHGVRDELLEAQARVAGLDLHRVMIPSPCSDEQYANAMRRMMEKAHADGVTHVIFGDVYLEDVRRYREERMAQVGMSAVFPLWERNTKDLAYEMIEGGLKSCITCLDPRKIPREFAGRAYDRAFLEALPADADPCGENGEFHTFVHAGPMFGEPIAVRMGETVERDGFVFTDVLPADDSEAT